MTSAIKINIPQKICNKKIFKNLIVQKLVNGLNLWCFKPHQTPKRLTVIYPFTQSHTDDGELQKPKKHIKMPVPSSKVKLFVTSLIIESCFSREVRLIYRPPKVEFSHLLPKSHWTPLFLLWLFLTVLALFCLQLLVLTCLINKLSVSFQSWVTGQLNDIRALCIILHNSGSSAPTNSTFPQKGSAEASYHTCSFTFLPSTSMVFTLKSMPGRWGQRGDKDW